MNITVGDISRLEVEGAAARETSATQRIRADEAAAEAERAHRRAIAASDDARVARESEFLVHKQVTRVHFNVPNIGASDAQ